MHTYVMYSFKLSVIFEFPTNATRNFYPEYFHDAIENKASVPESSEDTSRPGPREAVTLSQQIRPTWISEVTVVSLTTDH